MKEQLMMLNPVTAPLWIAGLVALFFSRALRPYRVLGWTYVVVLITFIALEAKNYYVAPIYPVLFAAGAVWFFAVADRHSCLSTRQASVPVVHRRAFGWVVVVLVVGGGLIAAPLATPILPPDRYLAYQSALGVTPSKTEVSHTSAMPQLFAD